MIVRGDESLSDDDLPGRNDQSWAIDAEHSGVLTVDTSLDAEVPRTRTRLRWI